MKLKKIEIRNKLK